MRPEEKLNITIVGTGYVGLTTGMALAYLGHQVTCVDKNTEIIDKLDRGISTIYEPGLEEMLSETSDRTKFVPSLKEYIHAIDILIIAVGTPSKPSGDTDLTYVEEVAREVGSFLSPENPLVVVNKSTVPIGTAQRVETVISEELERRSVEGEFSVASVPEFLREGAALNDTFYPDRIVVGAKDVRSINLIRQMYSPVLEQTFTPPKAVPRPDNYAFPAFITTTPTSAELIKYAANAFLATKISFINEIAGIAEKVGADIQEVAKGIGMDRRIGAAFLNAGVGWGGSCFPKDTQSLLFTGQQYGISMPLLQAAVNVNYRQRNKIIEKLQDTIKVIRGSTVTVLGLSFKPNTDDIRESPSIDVIACLLDMGARVKVYDPVAMEKYRDHYPQQEVYYASSVKEAAQGADAITLLTDWEEFVHVPWKEVATIMRNPVFIDGRNMLRHEDMRKYGFFYQGIGC